MKAMLPLCRYNIVMGLSTYLNGQAVIYKNNPKVT